MENTYLRHCCTVVFCLSRRNEQITFFATSTTTLLALSRSGTLEVITSCLKSLMYSDAEWSLMPSMNDILRYALSRPRMRSQMLVIPIAPLGKKLSEARYGRVFPVRWLRQVHHAMRRVEEAVVAKRKAHGVVNERMMTLG